MDKYEALGVLKSMLPIRSDRNPSASEEAVRVACELLERDLGYLSDAALLEMFRSDRVPGNDHIRDTDIVPVLRRVFQMGIDSVRDRAKLLQSRD